MGSITIACTTPTIGHPSNARRGLFLITRTFIHQWEGWFFQNAFSLIGIAQYGKIASLEIESFGYVYA